MDNKSLEDALGHVIQGQKEKSSSIPNNRGVDQSINVGQLYILIEKQRQLIEELSLKVMKENDEYLYIRNALETSSEAMAEEGDLVMTKEGGFVGIVVSVTRFENGRSEAKCFVFPDAFRLRNSIRIAIDKNEKSKYLSDFDTIGGKLLPRLKKLEQLR